RRTAINDWVPELMAKYRRCHVLLWRDFLIFPFLLARLPIFPLDQNFAGSIPRTRSAKGGSDRRFSSEKKLVGFTAVRSPVSESASPCGAVQTLDPAGATQE